MKVSGEWIENSDTQKVMRLLNDAGFQSFFVGGCVRNALMGVPVADIDVSTNARPETVMQLAKDAGFHTIPTGIDHGTVTVVSGGIPHEITTFRKDVETDGRRAVIAFANTIEEDARRRDFTMNALYAGADGTVVDPLGGLEDLALRRFRFIEDAQKRIQEDYLRILRFFRFNAWYGDPTVGLDPDAMDAIARNTSGLAALSLERVTSEVLKLLSAPDPAPSIAAMRHTNVLAAILPMANDTPLAPLIHLENTLPADPIRRLALIWPTGDTSLLRLSKQQQKHFAILCEQISQTTALPVLGYHFGTQVALDITLIKSAMFEMPLPENHLIEIERGANARFPITAADLIDHYSGPALGARLRQLEDAWIASNFEMTRRSLLALA